MADEDFVPVNPPDLTPLPLDVSTGNVVYKGITYTYAELMDIWEAEEYNYQDELALRRDISLDNQNLWGNKKNRFRDDWYFRMKPMKKRKGYPKDLE